MIIKEFKIKDLNLHYFIGINQIRINFKKFLEINKITDENKAEDLIFNKIEAIQNKFLNSTIQLIKSKYILNQDHIFTAGYFLQKAFLQNLNISNKRNIEIFLYLSTNRQISKGIDAFGITNIDLNKNNLISCIISSVNNLKEINNNILLNLNAYEVNITINYQTVEKFHLIQNFYENSNKQLSSSFKSYGVHTFNEKHLDYNLNAMYMALYDLLCEKMALLNTEKLKAD
jgi:tRNA threonylcarbamoyladenosine modification (KEOPS) complex Cgi121 subunit